MKRRDAAGPARTGCPALLRGAPPAGAPGPPDRGALAVPAAHARRARASRGTDRPPGCRGRRTLAADPAQPSPIPAGGVRHGSAPSPTPRPSWPGPSPAQLNATLKTDGGGTFTGVVQDAATGQVLFDRAGAEARVPASNMKLLTAAARAARPWARTAASARGRVPARARHRGPDRRGRRAARRRRSRPRARCWATPAWRPSPRATVRSLQADGVTGPVSVLLDDSLFTGPALSRTWSPATWLPGR